MPHRPTETEARIERFTTWVGSVPSLIAHSIFFAGCFGVAILHYAPWDMVLLILTTVVSLEAIYLAIFIQMTVNRQARANTEVSEDVEDIQEDVEEISKDVEEISEDVGEMQEDVEEISEDVGELQEDVEELNELDDWNLENGKPRTPESATIDDLTKDIKSILARIESLKK